MSKQTRDEVINQRALDLARKAGTALPAVDKSGKMINPHIPEYMSKAPWYLAQDATDGLQHQRKEEEQYDSLTKTYIKGVFTGQSQKYRKGACKNCGSMTHEEKNCFSVPRKKGAWKTNEGIMPDELIQTDLKLSYEGKRDRWNGSDAVFLAQQRQQFMEKVDNERAKKQAEEYMAKFQTEPDKDHMRFTSGIVPVKHIEKPKLVLDDVNNDSYGNNNNNNNNNNDANNNTNINNRSNNNNNSNDIINNNNDQASKASADTETKDVISKDSYVRDKVNLPNTINLDVVLDFGDDEQLLEPESNTHSPTHSPSTTKSPHDAMTSLEVEERRKRYREVENSFKKVSEYDFKNKVICVGSMRLRSDTAKYLFNLDPDSAHFDPKTRSMRMNPFEGSGKEVNDVPFAGENFLLSTGDIENFQKAQMFAWEQHKKGSDMNIVSNPTATELLRRETEERMTDLREKKRLELEQKYGKQPEVENGLLHIQSTENYVEFDSEGKLVRGLPEAIASSIFAEDVKEGNHTCIWGSYFDKLTMQWGYGCCQSTIRNAYCVGRHNR